VAIIARSGEHLLMLINDLLDLAKIEAGRLELRDSPLDLQQLLRHVADLGAVRAAQAGLSFNYSLSGRLPSQVHGDERGLRQILLNLIGNAVKFTPRGGVRFDVAASELTEQRCQLRFTVEDSGPGIAPEDLHRIFEPFVRAQADRNVEGTGLGLSITKRLLDAMGGTIEVESRVGVGTKFVVTLALPAESFGDVVEISAPEAAVAAGLKGGWATELYDLAMQGDVKELVARAEQASGDDPDGQAVYREIQRLAQKFDMKAIRHILRDAGQARA